MLWVIFISEIPARFMTSPDFCPDYSRFPATLFIWILLLIFFMNFFLIALFSGNRLSVDFSLCPAQKILKWISLTKSLSRVTLYGICICNGMVGRLVWGYRSKCLTSFWGPGEIHPSIVPINLSMIIRRLFIIAEWYNSPSQSINLAYINLLCPHRSERVSYISPCLYISYPGTICDLNHVVLLLLLLLLLQLECCTNCLLVAADRLKVALIKVCVLNVDVWNLLAFYAWIWPVTL